MIGTETVNGSAIRRVFALLVALAVLMLPVALPMAHAEPDYPPSFYKISASSFNARVGESIAFKAQTFEAGSTVSFDVSVDGSSVTSGTTTADTEGIARKTITFTVEGTNTVTMEGTSDKGEPLSLRTNVTITASGGNGGGGEPQADEGGAPFFGGGLPRTGAEIASTVLIGLVLLGGGAALVVATRRRRSS